VVYGASFGFGLAKGMPYLKGEKAMLVEMF
jgi:hypothetical protein